MKTTVVKARLKQFYRQIQGRSLPEQVVCLITNPRSGSTWLLDTLRCHPAIYMEPDRRIWEALNLGGRRYPRDLATTTGLSLEVLADTWDYIPDFSLPVGTPAIPSDIQQSPYAIEKLHPHFFRHESDRFLKRLHQLERTTAFKLIYQVRDPKESIVSFLQYKHRQPTWNAHRNDRDLAIHIRRIYEVMLSLATQSPGLILDYNDLKTDFAGAIATILHELWPASMSLMPISEQQQLIQQMMQTTKREVRQATGTPFLGKSPPNMTKTVQADLTATQHRFFATYSDEIERCYEAYRALLNLKPQGEHP